MENWFTKQLKKVHHNRWSEDSWSSSLFALFCLILAATIVYIFYVTELRVRLENELFDIRTKIKPTTIETDRIAVITISQADIIKIDGPLAKRPTVKSIENLIELCQRSNAEAILLMLPHQDYDYEDNEMLPIINKVAENKNTYIGTYDYNSREPSEFIYPYQLQSIEKKALGAGTLRIYRQGVVRYAPLLSYVGQELKPHILYQVALEYSSLKNISEIKEHNYLQIINHRKSIRNFSSGQELIDLPHIRLNYALPHHFLSLPASQAISKTKENRLEGRIVLIGYTAYRSRNINFKDGTHVNTPWEGELNPEIQGTPLIFVQALTLNNLLQGTWLKDVSVIANITQTIVVATLSFAIWGMSPAVAVVLFLCMCFGLLYIHGILFSYFNIFFPLSDTLLFAFLATTTGAFRRAHKDSRRMVKMEIQTKNQKKIANIHSRFLNRFSSELDKLNDGIYSVLSEYNDHIFEDPNVQKTYEKSLQSNKELHEYLSGIKQFVSLDETKEYVIRKEPVPLLELVGKILRQFEGMTENTECSIDLRISPEIIVHSDSVFLEPIIFNLISNALKYSLHPIEISIYCERINRKKLAFCVKDSGPGIDPKFQEKIFEKFYRIKNDEVYRIKGNGLGLYLCNFFAERIKAEITVESEIGNGAIFKLILEGK